MTTNFPITLSACFAFGGSADFRNSMLTAATSLTPFHAPQNANRSTRTFCLGRFLIDLPGGACLSGADYRYDFAQVEMPRAMSREQFDQEVDDREVMLNAVKHRVNPSLLRHSERPDSASRLLAFWEGDFGRAQVKIEGHRWINGQRFLIKDRVDDDKQVSGVNAMRDRLLRLRLRDGTDLPTDPGYCFEGGFIVDECWRNEVIRVSFKLSDCPDALLLVWIGPLLAGRRERPLLMRMNSVVRQLGNLVARVQVLRQGERTMAGLHGHEYLTTGPNSSGLQGHLFKWETQGDGTLLAPPVSIEFQSSRRDADGNPQQTRLTNERAIALWDRIVGSFRLRPVHRPARSEADPLDDTLFRETTQF